MRAQHLNQYLIQSLCDTYIKNDRIVTLILQLFTYKLYASVYQAHQSAASHLIPR